MYKKTLAFIFLFSLLGSIGFLKNTFAADDFVSAEEETLATTYRLNGDEKESDVMLEFGETLGKHIQWNSIDLRFEINDTLRISGNFEQEGNDFFLDAENTSTGSDVQIIANQGSDSDGIIKYNAAQNQWEVSNDGGGFEVLNSGDTVDSVNGQTGVAVLDTDDIDEGGTNLYYTQTRFDTAFSAKDTDDLSEGSTNLYFTDERVDDRVNTLLIEGEGINTVYDDGAGTLIISGEDASYTNKGISSFNIDDFDVTSGAVSIKSDVFGISNNITSRSLTGSPTTMGTLSFTLPAGTYEFDFSGWFDMGGDEQAEMGIYVGGVLKSETRRVFGVQTTGLGVVSSSQLPVGSRNILALGSTSTVDIRAFETIGSGVTLEEATFTYKEIK